MNTLLSSRNMNVKTGGVVDSCRETPEWKNIGRQKYKMHEAILHWKRQILIENELVIKHVKC
jgi:hypothetical protein